MVTLFPQLLRAMAWALTLVSPACVSRVACPCPLLSPEADQQAYDAGILFFWAVGELVGEEPANNNSNMYTGLGRNDCHSSPFHCPLPLHPSAALGRGRGRMCAENRLGGSESGSVHEERHSQSSYLSHQAEG